MMLLDMSIVECRCMGDVGMWSGLVDRGMSDVRPGPALRLLSIGVVLSAVQHAMLLLLQLSVTPSFLYVLISV